MTIADNFSWITLGKSAGKTKEACFTNNPGWRKAGRVLKTQISDAQINTFHYKILRVAGLLNWAYFSPPI